MADLANDNQRTTTGSGRESNLGDWNTHDDYWRSNFSSRPYAQADRGYDFYQPAYRFGTESATRYRGRAWNDVESDMRSGWDSYEHRDRDDRSTWDSMKAAVRDAWDRVTGDDHR